MAKIKIMHMADFHIGLDISFLGQAAKYRRSEVLEGFVKACRLANDNSVDIILIAGDFIESSSINQAYIDRIKTTLSEVKAYVFIVAGNHDYISINSPYMDEDWPKNVHIFKKSQIEKFNIDKLNTAVYGASFTSTYQRESFLDSDIDVDDNKFNIMVLHGDNAEDSIYNPLTRKNILKSNMRYIALGHIHKKPKDTKIGETYVAYAGSPLGQSFNELGQRNVMMVEINEYDTVLSELKIPARAFYRENIDVSVLQSANEVVTEILNTLKKYDNYEENYYQIILDGDVDENIHLDASVIEQLLTDLRYVKVIDKTRIKLNFDSIRTEQSLKGIFVDRMLDKIDLARDDEVKVKVLERAFELGLRSLEGNKL